jgi:hypothetical protein
MAWSTAAARSASGLPPITEWSSLMIVFGTLEIRYLMATSGNSVTSTTSARMRGYGQPEGSDTIVKSSTQNSR